MKDWFLLIFLVLTAYLGVQSMFLPISGWAVTSLFSYLALCFLLINLAHLKNAGILKSRITWTTGLFLAFMGWTAVGFFYSVRPDDSFDSLANYLAAMAFGVGLLLCLNTTAFVDRIMWAVILAACGHGLLSLGFQFAYPLESKLWVSIFPNDNIIVYYYFFPLAFCCFQYKKNPDRLHKIVAGSGFVLIWLNMFFTASRGGWLLLILGTILILGRECRQKDFRFVYSMAAGILITVTLFISVKTFLHYQRPQSDSNPPVVKATIFEEGLDFSIASYLRIAYWQGALDIFADHWLLGSGPHTFSTLYSNYDRFNLPPNQMPHDAHNLYLQTLAENGVVGFALLFAFVFHVYRRLNKLLKNDDHPEKDRLFYLGTALSFYLLYNLIGFIVLPQFFLYHFTLLVFLIDFLDRKFSPKPPATLGSARSFIAFAFSIFALGVAGAGYHFAYYNMNASIIRTNSFEEIAETLKTAKRLCPKCDHPYLFMSEALSQKYKQNQNPRLMDLAEEEIREARKISDSAESMYYLGQIRLQQGNLREARKYFTKALNSKRVRYVAQTILNEMTIQSVAQGRRAFRPAP